MGIGEELIAAQAKPGVCEKGTGLENGQGPTGIARFDAAMGSGFARAAGTGIPVSRRGFLSLALGAAAACTLPAFLSGCSATGSNSDSELGPVYSDDQIQSVTLFLFDTVISISAACSKDLMSQVSNRLTYFEGKFSRTVEGSDVWNINNAKGAPVQVSAETADCISKALEFGKESNGLFDITIGAVSSLWDFVEGVKPEDDAIAQAVAHVDYRGVKVDGSTVTLSDPKAMIDLGGIAKGYIADDIVSMFREGECDSASISLGGNVYVIGKSFDGDEWNVGVQDPNGTVDATIASIKAQDTSVVTSGLYERGFQKDGVFYYHILDPKTGYPAKTDLESSSITCESSTTADAYSTILFLMGHDAAMSFVEGDDRFECVLVDQNASVSKSNGSAFVLANQ